MRALKGLSLVVALLGALWILRESAPAGPTGGWMSRAGVSPSFATVSVSGNTLKLRYVRMGHGPSVLLLHGFASSIVTWRDVLPALAEKHDVIALDLPGFGGSTIPEELNYALFPKTVLAFMDAVGLSRIDLVGNSLGGAIAIDVAGQHPERVGRLILLDPGGSESRERPRTVRLAEKLGRILDLAALRRFFVTHALREVFYDPSLVTVEEINEYLAPLERPGETAALLSLRRSEPPGVFSLAARVRVPTLIVWGRQDRWLPVERADRFLEAIRGAKLEVLEACGHLPQEEQAQSVVRIVGSFLDGA